MSRELSMLANWLEERGELFLQIAAPEGTVLPGRKVYSLSELTGIIACIRLPGTSVLIWKDSAMAMQHPVPPGYDWIQEHHQEVMRLTAYVQYTDLFTPAHVATISEWLRERGELFVQIELPNTDGNGYYHVIDSLSALHRAVNDVREPEVEIFIWKSPEQPVPLNLVHSHPDEVMYFAVKQKQPKQETGNETRHRKSVLKQGKAISTTSAVC